MTTAVLNVKINAELKERLREYAQENDETLGAVTERLLLSAMNDDDISEDDIDSQHTEESRSEQLTDKEIKALRKLLKKKK
jgi:20S proteasome alpha/beta subunit